MSVDMGILAPDLVVYIDTPLSEIRERPFVSTLFSDMEFQEQICQLYLEPMIWEGTQVLKHTTCDNKWESRTRLMNTTEGDSLWKDKDRAWLYYGKKWHL